MKLDITWEVEDGYAGKSRPQHSIFDTDEDCVEIWDELTDEEKSELIDEFIQEEFYNKISFSITHIKEK